MADRVGLSAREACGIIVGTSCEVPYDPWNQNWNITIPDNKPPVIPIPDPKVQDLYVHVHVFIHC